ncbi:tyrosine-type recombinase/integrase [Candidatus Bathyarchaeota archaeon]|nr:tyrosine-type recombinase/integrase [Candidatus Bathyarchaeota archaeon]
MGKIEEFLKNFESKTTVSTYRYALNSFFKVIGVSADEYFEEKRNYEEDIRTFFNAIKHRPPKTVQLFLSAVRTFLVENDVELSERFWRSLRRRKKGSRALTMDKVPSNAELRRIITHMPVQGRALFLTLASSGMRIGEVLKLKLGDIDLDHDPSKIYVRGEYTKTGNPRIAFISREAKEAIEEWLKVREQYIKGAVGKSHKYKKEMEDDRVFPFENNTAYTIWRNALKKAGFLEKDKSTNRHTIHPHVLRKFFRTKMAQVIPVDVVEALMGHEGYLTEVYRRYSEEDLAKFYKQGEASILVFTEAEEIIKLRKEIDERFKTLQALNEKLQLENLDLRQKNLELKSRVKKLEDDFKNLEIKLKDLFKELAVSLIIDSSILEEVKGGLSEEAIRSKIEERLKRLGFKDEAQ